MPVGRPPKPTNLRVVQGNPGKRPLNKNEPTAGALDVKKPPTWLKGGARKFWREIAELLDGMNVATVADAHSLALLADALAEYIEHRETVRKEGATYETETQSGGKMIRQHPSVTAASDAWRRAKSMMTEFGLTASARARLSIESGESDDPFAEFADDRRSS